MVILPNMKQNVSYFPSAAIIRSFLDLLILVVFLQLGQTHEELVPPLHPGRQMLLVAGNQLTHLLWTAGKETYVRKRRLLEQRIGGFQVTGPYRTTALPL